MFIYNIHLSYFSRKYNNLNKVRLHSIALFVVNKQYELNIIIPNYERKEKK